LVAAACPCVQVAIEHRERRTDAIITGSSSWSVAVNRSTRLIIITVADVITSTSTLEAVLASAAVGNRVGARARSLTPGRRPPAAAENQKRLCRARALALQSVPRRRSVNITVNAREKEIRVSERERETITVSTI
jgi:hypothetical protein